MKNKTITVLIVAFALFFTIFIVQTSKDLSESNAKILSSKNVIDAGELISTRIKVTDKVISDNEWLSTGFNDDSWKLIKIPSYKAVQDKNFKVGNSIYYRIRIPKKAFNKISHLENESFFAINGIYLSSFDLFINGEFYKRYSPKNSGENRVLVPVRDHVDNLVAIKGLIRSGDTGIDSRDKVMLGKGVELNAIHSADYKAQTVFQLVFILCKGSILFIFGLIYLLIKVDHSFEKFLVFGLCTLLEELIAGDYFYGPLNFNQMVYFYDLVNVGAALSVFLFLAQVTKTQISKKAVWIFSLCLLVVSLILAIDSLHFNYFVDLSAFMKFWNLLTALILLFYFHKLYRTNKYLNIGLAAVVFLYLWSVIFSENIGLNLKAYGNLLLFILVAVQTFALFRKEQEELQEKNLLLIDQEKDVAIGKTASILAHDVRRPLDQMKIVIEKVLAGEANKEFLEVAKKDIDLSVFTVEQQVNEIINFSKSSSLSLSEISFYQVLNHAIKQILSVHQEMNLKLHYEFNCQSKVIADQSRLSMVLSNLIANAVEAIKDIGGRTTGNIFFNTASLDKKFIFKIINDGPEIPSHILRDIFKPLVTYGKANGTGLGLASVAKTIHEHGGSVQANNLPGKGVEFVIELQLGSVNDNMGSYNFQKSSSDYCYKNMSGSTADHDINYRVLVLETDQFQIQMIKTQLEKLPYKFNLYLAKNRAEIEDLISQRRYDLYLLCENCDGFTVKSESLSFLTQEVIPYSISLPQDFEARCLSILRVRPKVLFVDDTKMFRFAWMMFHGAHNISCASSPEEALQIISNTNEKFDVCVLDHYFTNSSMDGVALANEFKRTNPSLKILLSSSLQQINEGFVYIGKRDYEIRKFLV